MGNRNAYAFLLATVTLFTTDGRDTTRLTRNVCDPTTVGTTSTLLFNRAGCDSLVVVTSILRPELCGMTSGISIRPPTCAERLDGSATLILTEGVPPFQYRWTAGNGLTGQGQVTALNTPLQFDNLPAGAFSVTVSIPNTNVDTVIALNLTAPPALLANVSAAVTSAPYNMSCANARDGKITASALGGTLPYTFKWSNGATATALSNLGPGTYSLTVTDRNNCSQVQTTTLTAPPLLLLALDVEKPACSATFAEGAVTATGGVRPYKLLLNNQPLQGAFGRFGGGANRITLTDKNGCVVDTTINVTLPIKPTVSLPRDTLVLLGASISLTPKTNLTVWDTVIWRPLPNPDCAGCLTQTWLPERTRRYDVILIDTFGCRTTASTLVRVDRDIDIFVPNIFSPNGDGTHDVMTIGVSRYLEDATLDIFRIYDRWGDQAYNWDQPLPIKEWPGWDGMFTGRQPVLPGVYVWYLKVTLANGEVIERSGDVTVYR